MKKIEKIKLAVQVIEKVSASSFEKYKKDHPGTKKTKSDPMFKNVTVYDNGGETADRYTVVHKEHDGTKHFYGMSHQPDHPQGFNQYAGSSEDGLKEGKHLGKKLENPPVAIHKAINERVNGHYKDMDEHSHWSAYDMQNEGQEYNKLHDAVQHGKWDSHAAEKIKHHAHTVGYGDADSYHSGRIHDEDSDATEADKGLAAAEKERYDNWHDSEYMSNHNHSKQKLITANPDHMEKINKLFDDVTKQYLHGRKQREDMEKGKKKRAHSEEILEQVKDKFGDWVQKFDFMHQHGNVRLMGKNEEGKQVVKVIPAKDFPEYEN